MPRRCCNQAFGPEVAKKLIDRLSKALGGEFASLDVLQKVDPQQLAKFIHNEHPQTIALVLSHLNASQAAALLVSLPPEIRADVALRMGNLDQISPEIVNKIATVIGKKLQGDRRIQPRVLWRHPRRRGNVQPARFGHQQGDPRSHRGAESRTWSRPSAT